MPDEIRTEVHNTIHEAAKITITKKKKCKKEEWLSEEAFQIVDKQKAREKEKASPN